MTPSSRSRPSTLTVPSSSARQTNADAVLIELSTPGRPAGFHARDHREDPGLAGAGHRLCRSHRGARSLRRLLHPGIRRRGGDGSGHQHRRGASRYARRREDGRHHEDQDRERLGSLHAFLSSGPRGRNVQLAETAVRESKSWTDQEALQQHLIDMVARDQSDLFRQLEGRTIKRFDGKTGEAASGRRDSVDELPMTLRQRILDFLLDPNIAFLVLAVGALALYAEFNHPGAIVPGVVGVVFHPAGAVRAQPAADALRRVHAHHCGVRPVRAGGEVRHPRHSGNRWHRSAYAGRPAAGGWSDSANAGEACGLRSRVSVPLGVITVFLMTIALRARRNKVVTGLARDDWRCR